MGSVAAGEGTEAEVGDRPEVAGIGDLLGDADTILIGPGERYTVLIHADTAGVWAWHCHILPHAESDQGMFGMVTAMIVK